MSSDNYLLVGKTGNGRYAVWHCFASDDDPLRGNQPEATFDSAGEAITAAHRMAREDYPILEYGVVVSQNVDLGSAT